MNGVCNYKILPELKLVIGKYTDQVSEKEVISLKDKIKHDKDFGWDYNGFRTTFPPPGDQHCLPKHLTR